MKTQKSEPKILCCPCGTGYNSNEIVTTKLGTMWIMIECNICGRRVESKIEDGDEDAAYAKAVKQWNQF